jgi:hypothetical protein
MEQRMPKNYEMQLEPGSYTVSGCNASGGVGRQAYRK